jgi:8-oxo-dGTP diphosphatase
MPKPSTVEKCKYMFTDDIKFLQKALVFHPEKDGLFLALKRSPDSFSRPNDWDLPGGNVLFGELHEESLRKEILEESNLEVEDFSPVQIVTNFDEKKSIYFIFNGFYCQAKSGEVKLSDEHTEFRWVEKDEFIAFKPGKYLVDFVKAAFEGL